jgi:hypothetical protein
VRMANENGHSSIVYLLSMMDCVNNYYLDVKYSDILSNEECQVCYIEQINVKYNLCSHELCKDCMYRWRITKTTCPFCRTRII